MLRILDFVESELADAGSFEAFSRGTYGTRGSLRRDAERWTENIVNTSLDIAKTVLASMGRRIPETYREALRDLAGIPGFPREELTGAAGYT